MKGSLDNRRFIDYLFLFLVLHVQAKSQDGGPSYHNPSSIYMGHTHMGLLTIPLILGRQRPCSTLVKL
jgi:hypothetical protein